MSKKDFTSANFLLESEFESSAQFVECGSPDEVRSPTARGNPEEEPSSSVSSTRSSPHMSKCTEACGDGSPMSAQIKVSRSPDEQKIWRQVCKFDGTPASLLFRTVCAAELVHALRRKGTWVRGGSTAAAAALGFEFSPACDVG